MTAVTTEMTFQLDFLQKGERRRKKCNQDSRIKTFYEKGSKETKKSKKSLKAANCSLDRCLPSEMRGDVYMDPITQRKGDGAEHILCAPLLGALRYISLTTRPISTTDDLEEEKGERRDLFL